MHPGEFVFVVVQMSDLASFYLQKFTHESIIRVSLKFDGADEIFAFP
jgi:hypothetical protein